MLMRSLNRSFLGLIVLAVSFLLTPTRVFAADVSPLYFESVGASSDVDHETQQKYWEDLMKYKIWGTSGVVFNKENVIIKETSGLNGTATGDFEFRNGNHRLGGPILSGGSLSFSANNTSPNLDSLYKGPMRVLGDLKLASWYNAPATRYEGDVCVKGNVVIADADVNNINTSAGRWMENVRKAGGKVYGPFAGADGSYEECPESVPNVDTHLTVPTWDIPAGVIWHPAISMTQGYEETAYLDVPPIMDYEDPILDKVYDLYLEKIEMAANPNKYLYIRMPSVNKRFVRIRLKDGLDINASANSAVIQVVYVNEDAQWDAASKSWTNFDASKATFVENGDYAGDVLFYTTQDMNWSAMIEPSYQGTFMTSGSFTIKDHFVLAGQLIAKNMFFESDITGDFRYVPFDPPVLDPELFTAVEFKENNDDVEVPVKLSKVTNVEVSFKYCFDVSKDEPDRGVLEDANGNGVADLTDFNKIGPLCGEDTSEVIIAAKTDRPTTDTKIIINAALDPYSEVYKGNSIREKFILRVMELQGAVMKDNSRNGSFNLYVLDVNVVPTTRDTSVVAYEDVPVVFDTVSFVFNSVTGSEFGGIIIKTVPAEGSLTYFGKTVTKDMKIPADSLKNLVFEPVKDSSGKGDDYAYSSFVFAVFDKNGAESSDDKKNGVKTFTVNVTPVNDPPVVKPATYTISGHVINGGDKAVLDGTIPVTDVDDKSFTYAFDKSDKNFAVVDSLFAIDESTGKIHVKAGIELNENISAAQYTINVIVSDKGATTGGKDIQSATSKVTIEINYKNNPPQIVTDVVHIKENSEPGSATDSSLVAVDKDAGDSVKTFKLVSKSNWFEVSEDGVITVKKDAKIDYEKAKSETLKIQVCDEYNACSESSVVVAIVDVPKSQVKIVEGENPQNTWPNPTTIYTNIPQMELKCTFDGSKTSELCMDTTLVEGCQDLVVKFDNPDLDGAAYDTVEVCYSNAAPVVTIAATENVVKANNIYTIVEKQDADDPNIYVNDPKNLITVTVNDAVLGVPDTFFVGLNLETVALSKNTYSTMESVVKSKFVLNEDRQVVRTPVNGELVENSYVESFNGKDSVKISFNTDEEGNVIKTAYYNEKGKIDSMEVITVSYVTRVGDKYVTVSYQADAVTGKVLNVDSEGNLYESSSKGTSNKGDTKVEVGSYKVSYDYKDGDNFVTVTYAVSESGEIVANESGDIGYKVSYSYTNKFGNSATQSVSIILDRVGPKVEIVSPVEGSVVYANYVDVIWTVNGVEQDTLLLQSLEKGTNAIVRFFKDKAGNMAADTVYVVMKDAKDVEVSIEQPVTVLTQEKVEEYYAANPPKKGETFAVSIRNPTTGKEVETLIGGKFDPKAGSGKEPYPGVSGSTHLGPTLAMDIKLPIINAVGGLATLDDLLNADGRVPLDGVDADNSDRISVEDYVKNYCVDDFKPGSDFSSANLYNSKMDVKIWVYTTLGNFVDYFSFTQDMNDPSFTNEAGLLQMFFEMKPDKDGYVRAENGTLYATGAYLYKVDVKLKSELKCTLPPVNDATGKKKGDIVKSSDDLLKPFGYKRPQLQKQKKKKH
ncbi:MAG: hypothetical protein MJY98_10120 [Fibrobacter sp.]|nr:hypothetical protein [Fibrobacter sp.]